jgi:glucans biosynthesis protein
MLNGRGETLWRPLNNPRDLQISSFADVGPRGFGLIQRQRDFFAYQDLESNFEKRPSLWAEPIGDWGEGSVQLLEIPTKEEIHDNISAFWHPKAPLQAKGEYGFTYRLHWGQDRPVPPPVAKFSRSGAGLRGEKAKLFVLDLAGKNLKSVDPQTVKGVVTADKTEIRNIVTQPNPQTGGWRLSFEMLLKDKTPVELRASLMEKDALISEVWVYRWAP